MGIDVFSLCWSVPASVSAVDDMVFFTVTHYVRMGPLSRGWDGVRRCEV